MAKKLPSAAFQKKAEYYGYLLHQVMSSMIRSKKVVVGITLELKKLTEERMDCVAGFAGEYYAKHNKKVMSQRQREDLKTAALSHGLKNC
jgi:hypothetical protein